MNQKKKNKTKKIAQNHRDKTKHTDKLIGSLNINFRENNKAMDFTCELL